MIRRASIADIPHIAEVEKLSFPMPWHDTIFKAQLNNPGFFVYQHGEKVIGYAIVGDLKGKAHLQNIAIHPDFRRSGAGTELLEWCIDVVRLYGYREMVLEVREKNVDTQSFYAANQFKVKGTIPGYYIDDNALLMSRKIPPLPAP